MYYILWATCLLSFCILFHEVKNFINLWISFWIIDGCIRNLSGISLLYPSKGLCLHSNAHSDWEHVSAATCCILWRILSDHPQYVFSLIMFDFMDTHAPNPRFICQLVTWKCRNALKSICSPFLVTTRFWVSLLFDLFVLFTCAKLYWHTCSFGMRYLLINIYKVFD